MRTGVARCERLAPSDMDDELGDGDSGSGGGFSHRRSAGRGKLRATGIGPCAGRRPAASVPNLAYTRVFPLKNSNLFFFSWFYASLFRL